MPQYNLFFPCTPPPTYDLAAQRNTIAMLREQDISRLFVTHWGPHDDVEDKLRRAHEKLEELVAVVTAAMDAGDEDVAAINARWLPEVRMDYPGALIAESWGEMSVVGLMRYEKKRREREQSQA
jgi:hypothetical protein